MGKLYSLDTSIEPARLYALVDRERAARGRSYEDLARIIGSTGPSVIKRVRDRNVSNAGHGEARILNGKLIRWLNNLEPLIEDDTPRQAKAIAAEIMARNDDMPPEKATALALQDIARELRALRKAIEAK